VRLLEEGGVIVGSTGTLSAFASSSVGRVAQTSIGEG
jgi:hypothetical protein